MQLLRESLPAVASSIFFIPILRFQRRPYSKKKVYLFHSLETNLIPVDTAIGNKGCAHEMSTFGGFYAIQSLAVNNVKVVTSPELWLIIERSYLFFK